MWVKFHDELTEGEKRGIPRAVRFVYMELSLKARKRKGWIPLASGMSDNDAVHDLLGGNRTEIVKAVKILTAGPDPMIRFEDTSGGRRLVVVNWGKWNKIDDSADRVRRYRDRGNVNVTRYTRVSNDPVTSLDTDTDTEKRSAEVDPELTAPRERARAKAPPHAAAAAPASPSSARAVSAAPPPGPAPGTVEEAEAAIFAELRKHAVFNRLNPHAAAKALAQRHMTRVASAAPTKLEWVLDAIGECAADHAGAELAPEALGRQLRKYVENARRPRRQDTHDERGESLSKRVPDGMPELAPAQPVEVMQANAAKAMERFRELQAEPQGPVRRPMVRPSYPPQGGDSKARPAPRSVPATAVH